MTTGRPPGLAIMGDHLYMIWKGISGDEGIWWSSFGLDENNSGWAPQQQIPNVGTSVGPSLSVLPVGAPPGSEVLVAAWKGVDGDEGIWFSTFDGTGWTDQEQIQDVGTSVGPSLGLSPSTKDHPAILFAAWKGMEGDERIWWSVYVASVGSVWSPQQQIPDVGTSIGPSLGVFSQSLGAAWKGMENDDRIWWSTFDFTGWAWLPQQQIPNVGTSVGPSLGPGVDAGIPAVASAAWKGVEGDEGIWWSTFDGTGWAAQQQIPNVGTSVGPALSQIWDWAADAPALFAVWKGVEGDDGIYWSTLTFGETSWAAQQQIPGVGTGP